MPTGGKMEVRFKGPNVTPGYWRNEELTREAFDEEGFYRMGDALRPMDPADPGRGYLFDGRTAENFKLASGTWVAVGSLRAALVDAMHGLIRDAVIVGENRDDVGALLIPFRSALEPLIAGGKDMSDADIYAHPAIREAIAEALNAFSTKATGSSMRIVRAAILEKPPSVEAGEMTDKGSLNQRLLRSNNAELVEALYAEAPGTILTKRLKEAG